MLTVRCGVDDFSTSPEAQKLRGATKSWVETWSLVLADLSVFVLDEIL